MFPFEADIVARLTKRFSQFSDVWVEVDENDVSLILGEGDY